MKTTAPDQQHNTTNLLDKPRSFAKRLGSGTAAAFALLPILATAGPDAITETKTTQSDTEVFDKIWSLATLYKNDSNPILEEFKLRGRYQGQFYDVESDQAHDNNWEDRRSRFGFDAKLFDKKLEARFDFQSNDEFRDLYDGLVDAYLRWKPTKTFSVTLGKTKPLIAQYDWLESTNSQPTFERSQIFNQLGINRATALTVEGSIDDFSYRAGVYLNGTPTTTGGTGSWGDGEFVDHDGGKSFSLGVGYDFKNQLGVDKADLKLDWLHSDIEPGDLVLNRYDDIISTTFWVKEGPAAVVLEAFLGTSDIAGTSDVFGFYIEPTYDIIPKKLQLVGRYTYSQSADPGGLRGQSRYEGRALATEGLGVKGDEYNAFYLGAQYFIYGDKLKLLAGAEYSVLTNKSNDVYDGITYLAGIRFSF